MLLSLFSACGATEEPVATPEPTVETIISTPEPEPTPEPEYEYSPVFTEIAEHPENMNPLCYSADGWYVSGSDFNQQDGSYSSKLCLIADDGSISKIADATEGYEISGAAIDNKGNVIRVESAFEDDGMVYYLVGSSRTKIKNEDGLIIDASSMKIDESGNALMLADGSIIKVSLEGDILETVPCDGLPVRLIELNDGSVELEQWTNEQLFLGDDNLPDSSGMVFDGFGNYKYCYNDNIQFCTDSGKLFNWTSVDISVDEVMSVAGGDALHCFLGSWNTEENGYDYELAEIFCYIKGDAPAKKTLTLASLDADYELQNMLVKFNRSQPDFRVELEVLPAEEIENCGADIINLSGLDWYALGEKGLLEDVMPYLGEDAETIFPNIMNALTVDGKLYSTCSGFSITSLLGYAGLVGGKIGWTYDDFFSVINSIPSGETIFDPETASRDEILRDYLGTMRVIDSDSEEYKKAVEIADTAVGEPAATQLLERTSLFTYEDIILNDLKFDGNAVFVGLPVSEGSGNLLVLYPGFAMSSTCEDKDTAWCFLKQFFTEEYQGKQWYFPSNMNAFNAGLAAAQEMQYEGEEQMPRAVMYSEEGVPTYYYSITAHQAQELLDIVNSAKVFINNPKIEEALK